ESSSPSNVTPPVTVIAFVVGPIDPATNRGLPGVENSSAACRASTAARLFNSCAFACSPYSASTSGVPPKLLVSTMSAPASKYLRWMSSTTSGRVRTRFSLHPSSAAPPKSAAVRLRCCSIVPIAPSSTRMRSARSSRKAFSDSFKFLIRSVPFDTSPGAFYATFGCSGYPPILLGPAPEPYPFQGPSSLGPSCQPPGFLPQSFENAPNLSVTTREHLAPRPLPLGPAFSTLKYS